MIDLMGPHLKAYSVRCILMGVQHHSLSVWQHLSTLRAEKPRVLEESVVVSCSMFAVHLR
jgi:hypothetical protein